MAGSSQKILHVAGFNSCGFFTRTLSVVRSLAILFPRRLKVVPHGFESRDEYRHWLIDGDAGFRGTFVDSNGKANTHSSSPFCWFDDDCEDASAASTTKDYLGGHDDTIEWCRTFMSPSDENAANANAASTNWIDDGHTADHPYEYDLCVIGGGSGGMAAAKEAAALGAKVACLDFVPKSPHGSTWGLGGTCVNVGCIPKKLMHQASLIHESVRADTPAFGLAVGRDSAAVVDPATGLLATPTTTSHWDVLRDNVQNYIRSLNFKYRVRLREKDVTYLNKLAAFKDAHTVECVDKKGKTSTLTASRFLISTGGRPTPLGCEGADLAISSDDVFMMQKPPGKTLCIGASYISLECAGFLAGLGFDVTVAVRSILLRGFDQECADRVGAYMEASSSSPEGGGHNLTFKRSVTPQKLEKVVTATDGADDNDQKSMIKVTFSDGSTDTYDTVLAAIGRMATTEQLGVKNAGINTNPKNHKIVCKAGNEQTTCPNIYAVGDVLEGSQELTPVAIQAGILLARRLFGKSTELMDYANVCTTVFTPIEYSCVGLSEDDAIAQFGQDNIEVYHREFMPLEWSLSPHRAHHNAFTKVVVDKSSAQQPVLGIHYVGPNAGEVMQGYGTAMKQGLSFKTLTDTVGIHPTCAEEIVTLSVTKSSGEDAAAGGC